MRNISIFKNGNNRTIRLPRDLDFEGVRELEIVLEGDCIILRPVRPRDRAAVDATTEIKVALRLVGTPIGANETTIAAGAVLVTNNVREFERVPGLMLEDWVK